MIKIFPNIEALNNFAAEKFVEIAIEAIEKNGSFTIALAGGSTPKALYKLLASEKFKDRFDWFRGFFFFGDERNVSGDDPESNFRMANENLFAAFKPRINFFRWKTEFQEPEKIAENYDQKLRDFFVLNDVSPDEKNESGLPEFDLILLGMGADGHTASLFPFTEALHETERFAVANRVEKLETTRLTLTFPVINNARNVMFLVVGEEKAEALKQVLEGDIQPDKFPSQSVKPENGNLFWLVDEKAASLLNQK